MVNQIMNSNNTPVIVAGDFNTPSDEDWIDRNRAQHFGLEVQWPTTKLLKTTGMRDSFRVVHPDPVTNPGITWPVFDRKQYEQRVDKQQEVKDRIDFIFYHGTIRPISSATYKGSDPIGKRFEHKENKWPSDHYAVITDF
ncbi:hypothetical protein PFISCL1PPCAC_25263, partial [Pristionchus fissidentatus]